MYFKVCSRAVRTSTPESCATARETEKEAAPAAHGNDLTQMDTSPVYQPAGWKSRAGGNTMPDNELRSLRIELACRPVTW